MSADEWFDQVTKIPDMTIRQAGYLHDLCKSLGEKFDPDLNIEEAAALITRLKRRVNNIFERELLRRTRVSDMLDYQCDYMAEDWGCRG